jgi:hypothetical protein
MRLSLAASMVATLLLFAAADIALPSVHWALFLGPLGPLSFAVAVQWNERVSVAVTRMRSAAALVMVASPVAAFGSLAPERDVPSIIWFIGGVSAIASLLASMSIVGVDSRGECGGESHEEYHRWRNRSRDNNKMQQSKLGQAMELRC